MKPGITLAIKTADPISTASVLAESFATLVNILATISLTFVAIFTLALVTSIRSLDALAVVAKVRIEAALVSARAIVIAAATSGIVGIVLDDVGERVAESLMFPGSAIGTLLAIEPGFAPGDPEKLTATTIHS